MNASPPCARRSGPAPAPPAAATITAGLDLSGEVVGLATGITLEVRPSNTAAIALYRHLGFAVEGVRPRPYHDGEDALLTWSRETR